VDLSALEANCAICGGEQRKVFAYADIPAGEELCSALPDKDRAGCHLLAAKHLYASILGIAVPAVSGRALSLLMCHNWYLY
jgi:hypothetical protein